MLYNHGNSGYYIAIEFPCLQIVDWLKLVRAKVPQLCDPKIQTLHTMMPKTMIEEIMIDWVLQSRNLQKQLYYIEFENLDLSEF